MSTVKIQEMYRFYVETADGRETEWRGLTKKQARDMYAYTDAHQPSNVTTYGWEQIKPPLTVSYGMKGDIHE